MARYTVNLSKAKKFSRRKRAKKAMAILQEELEKREGEDVSISPEINVKIWRNGVENPPTRLEVEVRETGTGKVAVLPGAEPEPEPETGEESEEEEAEEEENGEEDEETREDEKDEEYREAVSGTVGEAKEAIEDMEDPDYARLLELEEEGKDRKTLKEFLESRV